MKPFRTSITLFALAGVLALGISACPESGDESVSEQVATAPQDDHPAVPPDPPNGEMTSPPIAEAPPSSEYSFPYAFPYVVERACEGDRDGCAYGEWLACGSIPVYASRDNTAEIVTTLEASDRFEVLTGNIVIESPGIVAVTRPSRPIPWEPGEDIFQPSDTLYVFHYRGEGFYTVWFKGEFLATEQFWPRSTTPSDPEFGGTLVQEVESVFWVQIRPANQAEGWVVVDYPLLAFPNSHDFMDVPRVCR